MANDKNMTKSQAKRAQRQAEAAQKKRRERTGKIISYLVYLAIVALIAWAVTSFVMKQANKVEPSSDYSAGLKSNGYIDGVNAADDILLPDYNTAIVPLADIEFTETDIQSAINNVLNAHLTLDTNPSLEVKDGDLVNIDYVGTIDNVEFDGGSSTDYDLEIGSGTFIEGFEDQLIGATVTSELDVHVTFPEDYSSTDLAGKAAVFHVTVNGIKTAPAFDDAFVAENLSEYATTVEGYKQYLVETNQDEKLTTWVQDYITTNAEVKNYKKSYLKTLKSIQLYDDEASLQSLASFYESYGMEAPTSPADANGLTEDEYLAQVDTKAMETYRNNLAYQAIIEIEGESVDATYYKDYLVAHGNTTDYYDSLIEEYGEPYVTQLAIKQRATEILKEKVTIQ